jgi:8-oxo-dGTP pyrophosphatase MutT (NUDIX family)
MLLHSSPGLRVHVHDYDEVDEDETKDAEFKEEKHPREAGGKFTEGGGSKSKSKQSIDKVEESFTKKHGVAVSGNYSEDFTEDDYRNSLGIIDHTLTDLKTRFPKLKFARRVQGGIGVGYEDLLQDDGLGMYIPENGGELYLSGQLIIDTPQPLKRGGVKVDEKTTVVGGTLADLLRHEIGHSLEEAVGRLISVDKVFAANKDSISKELSTYASLNPKEWIAESFSAYSHQDYGKSGVRVNPLLEKAFDRITGVRVHVHDDWVESEHKRSKGGQFGSGAAHFKEGDPDPPDLHGVPFKPFKPPADWSKVEGQADISEPPLNSKGKKVGAGLLMREPDGRVWIIKPTNAYGGYKYTFPKGGREKGHSLQATAIKEAFEESGLKGRIVGHAGDYEGDTSMTRYYHAVREGGTPTGHGWESEGVSLVPHHQLHAFLNRGRDRKIASEHLMPPKVHDAQKLRDHDSVMYERPSQGPHHCAECEHFHGRDACAKVEPPISPIDCCKLWTPSE